MRTFLVTLILVSLFCTSSYAQLFYEIEFNEDLEEYVLAVHSDESWDKAPFNRTSTAQITIKAPTGTFYPSEIKNLIPNVLWEHNSTYEAPEEAPGHDYFSFGLSSIGTSGISYLKGEKTPLISFKNKFDCSESVQLINNESDPFMYPNKSGANIGNHITVLGAFKSNSYSGNINETTIPCQSIKPATDQRNFLREHFGLYPNPVVTTTNLTSDWPFDDIEVDAEVLDLSGRSVATKSLLLKRGSNTFEFDLSNASDGIYYIKLQTDSWQVTIDEVAKIE